MATTDQFRKDVMELNPVFAVSISATPNSQYKVMMSNGAELTVWLTAYRHWKTAYRMLGDVGYAYRTVSTDDETPVDVVIAKAINAYTKYYVWSLAGREW